MMTTETNRAQQSERSDRDSMPARTPQSDLVASRLALRARAFAAPSAKRSLGQLLATALFFAGTWASMWLLLDYGYWITLLLAVPAAGLLLRFFVIQHDCGHG